MIARPFPPFTATTVAALMLTGCASSGDFPSLARRDVERFAGTAEPAPADPAPPPEILPQTDGTAARLAGIVNRARTSHGRFAAVRSRAEGLTGNASGTARGSESWAIASVAIGELDAARGVTMGALADLDTLYTNERVAHYQAETGDALAINAALQSVAALVAEEDRVLTELAGRLGR